MWDLDSAWYSPKSLLSPPAHYDFPGDRFIPNRSLMDLDQAQSLLTNRTKKIPNKHFNDEYRKKLDEKLSLDSEGKPFRMLVFRGSQKSSRKSIRKIDEMREQDAMAFRNSINPNKSRKLPKSESRILDAPNIRNDYYTNLMDWGKKNNILAVALGSEMYLWNSENCNVLKLFKATDNEYPTSVAWSKHTRFLGIGFVHSKLQLWDAETSKPVRTLEGHSKRVATIAWNDHILTSGSHDRYIINHDVRARKAVSRVKAHRAEVCGLKWSARGNILASGGNENFIYLWDSSKMSSSNYLNCFKDHSAAVKALAWSPHDSDVLASGGGTEDRCIKIWNVQKGTCIRTIDTKAQVCGLEWNRHHKELLSGHGFSTSSDSNQLCLWRYPSMTKLGGLDRHGSRVLHLAQSPDGLTVVSAGADDTLRFWDVFGPPVTDTSVSSNLSNLLSLKISPIR